MKRADVPGDDGVARQRGLVGHSESDEERGDNLFVTMIKRPNMR